VQECDDIIISVVIPTYNRRDFLSVAMASVLNQKWEVVDDKWELIVVDDASSDDTQLLVKRAKFAFKGHLKCIRHEINSGISKTLNDGILASRGRYICWLSDDDYWLDNKIAIQYEKMIKTDVPLSYSDYIAKDTRHNTTKICRVYPFKNREDMIKHLFYDCCINGSTIMAKREMFDKIGLFSEEEKNKWNQDLELWFRILMSFDNILHIPIPLITRTNHKDMLSIKYCGVGNEILFREVHKQCAEKGIVII